MAEASPAELEWGPQFRKTRSASFWGEARRFFRYSPVGTACAIILLTLLVVGITADRLAPYDPLALNYSVMKKPPSAAHWLGTDALGRDVLSRLIMGTRVTLLVALTSVFLGDLIGAIWGISSGYLGGKFDLISQRLSEILLAFPFLILAMLLMAALRPGIVTVVIAIAIARVAPASRTLRSVVLSIKENVYVEAARSIGATRTRILVRHITPQTIALFLVIVSMNVGSAVFAEAALSFLGVGVPPPDPSWGNMLGGSVAQAFRPPWWLVASPGVAITIAILTMNLLGDTLRDFFDPRLRAR